MQASRFECKYFLDPELAPAFKQALAPFVEFDPYAARSPQHSYPVHSIYLDTPDYRLCRETLNGVRNRFKLRIRAYSNNPDDPVFLETKRRNQGIVQKSRGRVDRRQIGEALHSFAPSLPAVNPTDQSTVDEFLRLSAALRLVPVAKVVYNRESYEAITGEPVRVTFDTHLMCAPIDHADFSSEDLNWTTPRLQGHILEIKFTERLPDWVQEAIRSFQLQRRSICKYLIGVRSGGAHAWVDSALIHGAEVSGE